MIRRRLGLAAAAWVALAACSDPIEPRTGLLVQIERASIDSSTLTVAFRVTNTGLASEYIAACAGRPRPAVERRQGAEWAPFSGGYCLANVSSAPIPVPGGASVGGASGVGSAGPGTYRLVLAYDSRGSGRVASAPFVVP